MGENKKNEETADVVWFIKVKLIK